MTQDSRGLYSKFTVTKKETGEDYTRKAFVLVPATDEYARHALLAYAHAVGQHGNRKLSDEILQALTRIGTGGELYSS